MGDVYSLGLQLSKLWPASWLWRADAIHGLPALSDLGTYLFMDVSVSPVPGGWTHGHSVLRGWLLGTISWTCMISCKVINGGGCAVLTLGLAWWRHCGALHLLELMGGVVWEPVLGAPLSSQSLGSTRTPEMASLQTPLLMTAGLLAISSLP